MALASGATGDEGAALLRKLHFVRCIWAQGASLRAFVLKRQRRRTGRGWQCVRHGGRGGALGEAGPDGYDGRVRGRQGRAYGVGQGEGVSARVMEGGGGELGGGGGRV
jgi:hypothetical protein